MVLAIIGAGIYYGWHYIEAVLIALPIPDPKELKENITKLFNKNQTDK